MPVESQDGVNDASKSLVSEYQDAESGAKRKRLSDSMSDRTSERGVDADLVAENKRLKQENDEKQKRIAELEERLRRFERTRITR